MCISTSFLKKKIAYFHTYKIFFCSDELEAVVFTTRYFSGKNLQRKHRREKPPEVRKFVLKRGHEVVNFHQFQVFNALLPFFYAFQHSSAHPVVFQTSRSFANYPRKKLPIFS